MPTYWKLTDKQFRTRPGKSNETLWGEGVTHTAPGEGDLCGPGWIHFYLSPELAVLLNPADANFLDPVLWEIEAEIGISKGQLKAGAKQVTTLRRVSLPQCSTEQRVKFAILCALKVYHEKNFMAWAECWLSGDDRSASAVNAVVRTAEAVAWWAEQEKAKKWAVQSAWRAAKAAKAAGKVARGRETEEVAWLAAEAVLAAEAAAAARGGVAPAWWAGDLETIAKEALS